MIQAVLFDVDGVVVHPWRFRDLLARDHGITDEMTAPFFKGPFLRCVQGRADLAEILPPFLQTWGWNGSVSNFIATWLSVENAPNDAVLDVVTEIRRRGLPCFVASTQERRRARYLAHEMKFNQLFDGLFFSSDVGVEKPNDEFYKAIALRLGRAGDELLFIDDASANVEGARLAGWWAEPFTTVEKLRADVTRHTGIEL